MKKISSMVISLAIGTAMVGCNSGQISNEEIVAKVNGVPIKLQNYELTLSVMKDTPEAMYGEDIWEREIKEGVTYEEDFRELMYDQMIELEVLYQEAKKLNLVPTKEQVDENVKKINEEVEKDAEYKKRLEEIGMTDEYTRQHEEYAIAINNYRNKFGTDIKITDEEIQKDYEENKESYYRDEVEASHILISTLDENDKPLSDEKKAEAKKEAQDILQKIKDGQDFAKLAKEHSDDTVSATKGGELGFFGKGQMVAPFEEAAYELEVGEVSDIVETDFGYHIIKSTDRVDEQIPLEEVKDSIKGMIAGEKYGQKIQELISEADIEEFEEVKEKAEMR